MNNTKTIKTITLDNKHTGERVEIEMLRKVTTMIDSRSKREIKSSVIVARLNGKEREVGSTYGSKRMFLNIRGAFGLGFN